MEDRRMFRHEVMVVGGPQKLSVFGPVVKVAAVQKNEGVMASYVVEFWAEGYMDSPGEILRTYQVFGTGHPLPYNADHRGTTERTAEGDVWHLYELLDLRQ